MKNSKSFEKPLAIIEAIIVIVCGILLACAGNPNILNIMAGIALLILGIDLLIIAFSVHMHFGTVMGVIGAACIGLGITVLCDKFNIVGAVFYILIIAGASIGFLFVINGLIKIIKHEVTLGLIELIAGAILATLAMLMIFVPEMRQAFWIITGIIIAIVGIIRLLSLTVPSFEKKLKK
ncbi:MAG: hypothetical protein K5765_09575 [Clostridia bacterium]|nr:hypothetical protein [Clostridia bacterium]